MAIPMSMMEKVIACLRELYKTGFRYPIPSSSSETDTPTALAKMYARAV